MLAVSCIQCENCVKASCLSLISQVQTILLVSQDCKAHILEICCAKLEEWRLSSLLYIWFPGYKFARSYMRASCNSAEASWRSFCITSVGHLLVKPELCNTQVEDLSCLTQMVFLEFLFHTPCLLMADLLAASCILSTGSVEPSCRPWAQHVLVVSRFNKGCLHTSWVYVVLDS